jgi:hypothetical protein
VPRVREIANPGRTPGDDAIGRELALHSPPLVEWVRTQNRAGMLQHRLECIGRACSLWRLVQGFRHEHSLHHRLAAGIGIADLAGEPSALKYDDHTVLMAGKDTASDATGELDILQVYQQVFHSGPDAACTTVGQDPVGLNRSHIAPKAHRTWGERYAAAEGLEQPAADRLAHLGLPQECEQALGG